MPSKSQAIRKTESFTHFAGFDISKLTLASNCLDSELRTLYQKDKSSNTPEGCDRVLRQILKTCGLTTLKQRSQLLVCCEHTGTMSTFLVATCRRLGIACWRADSKTISDFAGKIVREKTDPADALRIATFACRFSDKYVQEPLDDLSVQARAEARRVEVLKGDRQLMVKARAAMVNRLTSIKSFGYGADLDKGDPLACESSKQLEKTITGLTRNIKQIDALLEKALKAPHINEKIRIARSCPGVGPVLAANLVIVTHGFTRMKNPKKLATHLCVAPHEFSSGTSVRRRAKTSKKGNQSVKTVLSMAALRCIQEKGAYKEYYDRKMSQGKHHLVVLNAIRNKILHTVMACLKKNTMYNENYHVSTN